MKKLIYLATPYTHDDKTIEHARFLAVTEFAGEMMKKGHMIFSPITHGHPIALNCEGLPTDWNYWAEYSELMIKKCDLLLVFKASGWKESRGVFNEIKIATDNGIPVEYW